MEETALAIGGTILGVIVGGVGAYVIQFLVTRRGEALAARLELPLIRTMISTSTSTRSGRRRAT